MPPGPVEPEDGMRRLTQALSHAAAELVVLRDEGEVLEVAADVLAAQGFNVVTVIREGNELLLGPVRDDPATIAAMAEASGLPVHLWRRPYGDVPEFVECMETGRALYRPDSHALCDKLNPPPLNEIAKRSMPRRSVEAPFFVDGKPAGFVTALADGLTPAGAAIIELFARVVGAALENVRHHRRAADRVAELSRLQDELLARERMATVGRAAAMLSHEVRNPLGALLNAVNLLKRDPAESVRRDLLGILDEELHRIDALIGELQQLARPLEPRAQRVDLARLAEECVGRQPRAAAFELVAPSEVVLDADPLLLSAALENLLRNASQASPPGRPVRVEVGCGPERGWVAVEDHGPGVPEHEAEQIFQPFVSSRATGTGLGLAVVKRVMEAHGGTARVVRGAQGGARFELELPRR